MKIILQKFINTKTKGSILKQIIYFGIIGVSNTFVAFVLYNVLLYVFQKNNLFDSLDYIACQVLAYIFSVLWSFYWNNRLTFKLNKRESRNIWITLLKTYLSYSVSGLFLNNILLYVFVQYLNIQKGMAPLYTMIFTIPLNFILNKSWTFKPIDKSGIDA